MARAAQGGHEKLAGKQKRPSDLWSHERVREVVAALQQVGPEVILSDEEREFLALLILTRCWRN